MGLMETIQTNLIQLLRDHRDNSADPNYPVIIDAYGGEARNVDKMVFNMPAVYVDVPSTFTLTGQDTTAKLLSGDYNAELVLFEKNEASGSANFSAGSQLIDWCVEALRGKFVKVGDNTFPAAKNITGEAVTDLDPFMATLKLKFTSLS